MTKPAEAVKSAPETSKTALNTILVDTLPKLEECLTTLISDPRKPLAVDLEGNQLCRSGTLSVLQVYVEGGSEIYVVDVTVLKKSAFDHKSNKCASLGSILSSDRQKIVYDVRNDANALFHLYQVKLGGVFDLQLLELAIRTHKEESLRLLHGLGKTLEKFVILPADWTKVKEAGLKLFAVEKGGDGSVWDARPLKAELLSYSAQDVALSFELYEKMKKEIPAGSWKNWEERIIKESSKRVKTSQTLNYVPRSASNALAPNVGWGK